VSNKKKCLHATAELTGNNEYLSVLPWSTTDGDFNFTLAFVLKHCVGWQPELNQHVYKSAKTTDQSTATAA